MKVLHHILQIYSHHRRILQWMLPVACGLAIAAHVLLAMGYPQTAYCLFLSTVALSSVTSGLIMGQALKEGEETYLMPGYRVFHIMAAFSLPAILILWAAALAALCGGPILLTLSSFLSMAALSVWYGLYCMNGLLFRDNSRVVRFMSDENRSWIIYFFMLWQLALTQRHTTSISVIWSLIFILGCFICINVMTAWFGAYFLNSLSALAGGGIILWILYDVFRISEFSDASSWIGGRHFKYRTPENFWAVVLLLLALCAIILICRRYRRYVYIFEWEIYTYAADPYWRNYSFINYDGLKLPYMFAPESWQRDYAVCLWNRDKTHPRSVNKAEQIITQTGLQLRAGTKSAPLNQMLRFGLFSPVFAAGSDWTKFVGFCVVGTIMAFAYCLNQNAASAVNFSLPGILFFSAAILANDFQGHRNRLPLLYFQTALPSRKAFLDQSLRAYLRSVALLSLRIAITAALLHPLISWFCKNILPAKKGISPEWIAAAGLFHWSWDSLAQMIVMGIALALGQVAASLFMGRRRAYAGGPGWLVINALLLVPVISMAYRYHSWRLNIAFVLIAAALFLHARRNWLDTELDFA